MATRKKEKKARYISVAHHIKVAVSADGTFTYSSNGNDASVFRPNYNDTISWSVTYLGLPVTFQVEFDFSPFTQGIAVLRSLFLPTAPLTVGLPAGYFGNRRFKYTVTIANGWSDDPVVEPVPSDGIAQLQLNPPQPILLSVDNNGVVTGNPDPAPFSKGEVIWSWSAGSPLDDFTISFTNTPPGWQPLQATSAADAVALILKTATPPGQPVTYTVQTLHTGASGSGKLAIT